jgi:hypothetical protein
MKKTMTLDAYEAQLRRQTARGDRLEAAVRRPAVLWLYAAVVTVEWVLTLDLCRFPLTCLSF